jgi:hypothetical protein
MQVEHVPIVFLGCVLECWQNHRCPIVFDKTAKCADRLRYKEVLKRLCVRPSLIGQVINLVRERAEEVEVHASAQISGDPKDDAFCLGAESGNADFIDKYVAAEEHTLIDVLPLVPRQYRQPPPAFRKNLIR